MRFLPVAAVLLTLPFHAAAQVLTDPVPAPGSSHAVPVAAFPSAEAFAPDEPVDPGLHRVIRMVGGALAGAWVGFMASQVAVSDWEDRPGIDRSNWAASGAAFGVAMGLTLPAGGAGLPFVGREQSSGRDVLTMREIRDARGNSLYEVIRSLRPEWLRIRGTASMRETPRGRSTGRSPSDVVIEQPGIPTIRVYLDDALMGGIDNLRDMQPGLVGEVRFLNQAQATQRWGAGHLHGAILVTTAPVDPAG